MPKSFPSTLRYPCLWMNSLKWNWKVKEHVKSKASLVTQMVKRLPAMHKTQVQSLGREDRLEKEMATHSSILAGKFREQRNLVGYSPWGRKESDAIEWLNFTSLDTLPNCLHKEFSNYCPDSLSLHSLPF